MKIYTNNNTLGNTTYRGTLRQFRAILRPWLTACWRESNRHIELHDYIREAVQDGTDEADDDCTAPMLTDLECLCALADATPIVGLVVVPVEERRGWVRIADDYYVSKPLTVDAAYSVLTFAASEDDPEPAWGWIDNEAAMAAARCYPDDVLLVRYACQVDGDGPGHIVYADCPREAAEDYCAKGDWYQDDEYADSVPVTVTVRWGTFMENSTTVDVDVIRHPAIYALPPLESDWDREEPVESPCLEEPWWKQP